MPARDASLEVTRNTTCRPSSRNDGHVCAVSARRQRRERRDRSIDRSSSSAHRSPPARTRCRRPRSRWRHAVRQRRPATTPCRHPDRGRAAARRRRTQPASGPPTRTAPRPDRCPAARGFRRCAGPAARASPPRPWPPGRPADGRPRQARVQMVVGPGAGLDVRARQPGGAQRLGRRGRLGRALPHVTNGRDRQQGCNQDRLRPRPPTRGLYALG